MGIQGVITLSWIRVKCWATRASETFLLVTTFQKICLAYQTDNLCLQLGYLKLTNPLLWLGHQGLPEA